MSEQALWLGLIGLPCSLWAGVTGAGKLSLASRIGLACLVVGGTAVVLRKLVVRHLHEYQRRGEAETSKWRSTFAEVTRKTAALKRLMHPVDRSRDAELRGAGNLESTLPYVYSLTASSDVSFVPKQLSSSGRAAEELRRILLAQIALEMLRIDIVALFQDRDDRLVAITQLESTIQVWVSISVGVVGGDVLITERTGYQWWIPFDSRSRRLGLDMRDQLLNVDTALGDGRDLGWPYSRFFTRLPGVICCTVLACIAPVIGIAMWTCHVYNQRKHLARFQRWNGPSAGDSLDAALLANERSTRFGTYWDWRVETMVREDGTLAFPGIVSRIEAMRELVGGAVTQAVEEVANLSDVADVPLRR